MPESNLDKLSLAELWTFIVVIISGGIGGCAAAFSNRSNDKHIIAFLTAMGYCITGVFGSLVAFTFLSSLTPSVFKEIETIIFWSCVTGFSTAIGLAGTNLGFKIMLNKLGIEIEINVKRKPKKTKDSRG